MSVWHLAILKFGLFVKLFSDVTLKTWTSKSLLVTEKKQLDKNVETFLMLQQNTFNIGFIKTC